MLLNSINRNTGILPFIALNLTGRSKKKKKRLSMHEVGSELTLGLNLKPAQATYKNSVIKHFCDCQESEQYK